MKKNINRIDKIASQIHKDLMLIIRDYVKDPRVRAITINEVVLNADYSHAKIYWSILDETKKLQAQSGLNKATGLIRSRLSKCFTTYTVPSIEFIYDESLKKSLDMLTLIDSLNNNKITEDTD